MRTCRKGHRGDPRRAVVYCRASKDEQQLSPEAQRAAVEAWAAREGVEIVSWHLDQGVCSVTPIEQRPALCAALASLRELDAGVLVVAKRDRIARDVVISAMVERTAAAAGARIVSAAGEGNGDTPADAFMRTVIDGASAYERALIRARTKAALAVLQAAASARARRRSVTGWAKTASDWNPTRWSRRRWRPSANSDRAACHTGA